MKSIAFFNNKGGVGKTMLVYHIAYMMAELDYRVLVADLDPQANLSSMFLSEAGLYDKIEDGKSITAAIKPLVKGIGDIKSVHIEKIAPQLSLLIGNLELSALEDRLSDSWTKCLNGDEPAFRFVSAFYRIMKKAAAEIKADFVLIDVGPNLGAINRAALIASDYVTVPVGADLFSVQGIKNVGKTLVSWRAGWKDRVSKNPEAALDLPSGLMAPVGYIVSQHGIKERRPVKAYMNWAQRIPEIYRKAILGQGVPENIEVENDPHCLGLIRHYRSLVPMAMEVNKPIFKLRPADGAIGAHFEAVRKTYQDFKQLTEKVIEAIGQQALAEV